MRPSWPRSWHVPRGRDGLAVALAFGAIGAALLVFLNPNAPPDELWQLPVWRFSAGTAFLLAVAGVALLRRRPGLGYLLLAAASFSIAGSLEGAWQASSSFAQFSDLPTPGNPAFVLIGLAVLVRTAVPAAILTLYATAPERRIGGWVAVVGWGITFGSLGGALLRVGRELGEASGAATVGWWNELSYQLDEPIPIIAIAALAGLGSLRAASRRSVPRVEPAGEPTTGPSRLVLAAVTGAAMLWLPATYAFLNRAPGYDDPDGANRVLLVPILAALIGLVAERWSRVVAWSAVAVAFEMIAFIVLERAAADYVMFAISLPDGSAIPLPIAFIVFLTAATLIVGLAFAAVSVALRAAWTTEVDVVGDRRWAIRGALVGLALCGWFFAGAILGSGLAVILGAGFLPICAIPIAVGLGAWRRLVPAVAEAERVATEPFRPLRYLETVVAEAFTRRAEHRRLAVDEERDRLGSELNELQAAMRRLLSDGRLVLETAPAGAVGRTVRATSGLRRPSDREIDVINLLASGASNDEIAGGLVLSLKTVESHLRRLFSRYGVTNRTELAVLALREGWVEPS